MDFYKIIRDSTVVGVGQMFLRWYPSKHDFYYCDIDDAERVQDIVTERLYHADWLRDAPSGADAALEADVVQIGASEYDELYEQLKDGEEIPVPEPEPEPEPEPTPEPEPEPERPMTVQEMREAIADLTSMEAKDNYAKGAFFVLHDVVYQATEPILKGKEVKPGRNCIKTTLEDLI